MGRKIVKMIQRRTNYIYRSRHKIWIIGIALSLFTVIFLSLFIPYEDERVDAQKIRVEDLKKHLDSFIKNDDLFAIIYNLNPRNKDYISVFQSQALVALWSSFDKDIGNTIDIDVRFKWLLEETKKDVYGMPQYNSHRMILLKYLKETLDMEEEKYKDYRTARERWYLSIIILQIISLIAINVSEYFNKVNSR